MLGVAVTIGALVALASGQGCVAPPPVVSRLLQTLQDPQRLTEPPNPSVLLAMNLAGATEGTTHKWLLQEIKEEAVERAQKAMSSGQVALCVLALLSSCQDPRGVQALGQSLDLLRILQEKMEEEMSSLELHGVPKSTFYALGLATLGLCLAGVGGHQRASVALAKEVLSPSGHLSVDTMAVVALALVCAYEEEEEEVRKLLEETLREVTTNFLDRQEEGDGIIGNIYSTGLALQVLGATRRFYAPREWDCGQAFSVVAQHDFQQPTAIAQLLPALLGKSYLDAASTDCPPPSSLLALSPRLGTTQGDRAAPIQVSFSITNQLQGIPFSFTTRVRVPGGSTLLQVLQAAEKEEPEVFSFQTEPSSWGPMVVSIHGVAANPQDRTYWEFLSAGNPLQEGVGSYKPRDGEHIQAVLSTY